MRNSIKIQYEYNFKINFTKMYKKKKKLSFYFKIFSSPFKTAPHIPTNVLIYQLRLLPVPSKMRFINCCEKSFWHLKNIYIFLLL